MTVSTTFADSKAPVFGDGPAYKTLGDLPMMHQGRKKPLDTVARDEVKHIFGRETIKLHQAELIDGTFELKETARWLPVAALFDWSARPEFWDDQPFILVDYLPLKNLLVADDLDAAIKAAVDRSTTSEADRSALKQLAAEKNLDVSMILRVLKSTHLANEDQAALKAVGEALLPEFRWFTPHQLEKARVAVNGARVDFREWFHDLADRKGESEAELSDLEDHAYQVGSRLTHYQVLRDRTVGAIELWLIQPRPNNDAYLTYCADAVKKGKEKGRQALSPLELDAAVVLFKYLNDIPGQDRATPGTNPEFDKNFKAWLASKSEWVPLPALLGVPLDELTRAGFPTKPVETFREAVQSLDQAEDAQPGHVSDSAAANLLAAGRALGRAVNEPNYPTEKEMALESYFNATNPFFEAPKAYGYALAILAVSLGFASARRKTPVWWLGVGAYTAGLVFLLAGIGLEILGFSMRVRISGWAPVTNMYETVIWVSLVTAVLGLIFELIFRKTFAAIAGSAVALLGTVLAANVPLLDPGIRTLNPVLRSNYWLTIHVLTEVSSYAAFALAMGLGLIATIFYLTATYRRSPSYLELGAPAIPGVPMLALGSVGIALSYGAFGADFPADRAKLLYYAAASLASVGGILSIVGCFGMLGEAISRYTFARRFAAEPVVAEIEDSAPAATVVQTISVSEAGGAVATLTKPSVAEIRAMAARNRPTLDARGLSMQSTASKIKPLSTFIYRTMQVGVLLIAAGTILGGVWADYSWGRFWGWDPKEVWALITLLVYLIPLHGRFAGWVNTFGLVMASVACFLSVIMAWYGVNFVLGVGLHSYGFIKGGSQGVVGAVVLAVLAVAVAAGWRRRLASRVVA
jgi:ABC-type transport system involved in cytochrome c biogenesis permease subunit